MPATDRPLRLGVVGLGRLGSAVLDACAAQDVPVALTVTRSRRRTRATPTVLVDTSGPAAQDWVRGYCARNRVALVECVSNLDPAQQVRLAELGDVVPVVRATNLAIGHHLQRRLIQQVARLARHTLAPAETAVWERHPATKAHRPSATAELLARTWADGGGPAVAEVASYRAGLPVSDHEIGWRWHSEVLTLRHSVASMAAAAAGVLVAARWVLGRPPGLVTMDTVYDDLVRGACDEGST